MTYADVAEHTLGSVGKTVVEIQLVLSQTGFCAAYLIFIMETLPDLVPNVSGLTVVVCVLPFQVRILKHGDLTAGHCCIRSKRCLQRARFRQPARC